MKRSDFLGGISISAKPGIIIPSQPLKCSFRRISLGIQRRCSRSGNLDFVKDQQKDLGKTMGKHGKTAVNTSSAKPGIFFVWVVFHDRYYIFLIFLNQFARGSQGYYPLYACNTYSTNNEKPFDTSCNVLVVHRFFIHWVSNGRFLT